MMKSGRIAAAALFGAAMSLTMPSLSFAQGMGGPDSAWYIGATIGQSKVDLDCAGASTCDDTDTAWRVLGGYKINKNFAAEIGYQDFGKAKIGTTEIKSNAWELVGIGAWPFTNEFSIYGKAGFYRGEAKASDVGVSLKETNTDFTFGAGVQYDFSRQLGVRAEWQRYGDLGGGDLGKSDVDVMSIGVVFRFK